jgi:hypothetical protein
VTEQIAPLAGVVGRDADDRPAIVPSGWRTCRTCGADDEVRLVGVQRRAYACPHCDARPPIGSRYDARNWVPKFRFAWRLLHKPKASL